MDAPRANAYASGGPTRVPKMYASAEKRVWVWRAPKYGGRSGSKRPRGAALVPILPAHCRPTGARTVTPEGGGVWTRWTVDCGSRGLVGEQVGVGGPGSIVLGALVRVTLADGRLVQGVASPGRPLV